MEVEVATQIEEVKKCSVQYILALNDALNVMKLIQKIYKSDSIWKKKFTI